MIVPSPGSVFLAIDYSSVELCTLAQVLYRQFGRSRMRDIINTGTDLHRWTASMITEKPEDEITKKERQLSKALNFGLPGGLGIAMFCNYARQTFGVDIDENRARELKDRWLNTFPEMRPYLEAQPSPAWRTDTCPFQWGPGIIQGAARRVLEGKPYSERNREGGYPSLYVDWVWWAVAQISGLDDFHEAIVDKRPSAKLRQAVDAVTGEAIVWPSGRIACRRSYCQARNAPFQGLAADGAKSALYRLYRSGYRVVNFIHDEFLIELPEDGDHLLMARDIEGVVIGEMEKMCPDVAIRAQFALMRQWLKDAEAVYDHPDCPTRLLPWNPDSQD